MLILHLFLKQSSSLPTNCSFTCTNKEIRRRYMLVSKINKPSPSSSIGSIFSSIKCPWTWQVNRRDNRFPSTIVYARCGSSCDEWYCRPVRYNMIVLYRKKGSLDEWKIRNKKITVAFVYTK